MGHIQFWLECGSVGWQWGVVVAVAAAAAAAAVAAAVVDDDPSAASSAELLPFESPAEIW